jgi:hypothetical protein
LIPAFAALVAINGRPEVDMLTGIAFRVSIADPLTPQFAIVNAIISQVANMLLPEDFPILKHLQFHAQQPPTIDPYFLQV